MPDLDDCFVAIDFETADPYRDSACAIGLVRVEGGQIVARRTQLLRPPRSRFTTTFVHGITWAMVRDAPTFGEAWPALAPLLDGARFLAAHNAGFDRSVMNTCCKAAGLPAPAQPWTCTVVLARRTWDLDKAKLPIVAAHLGFTLNHHDAGSDAEACARIVIAAAARARGA